MEIQKKYEQWCKDPYFDQDTKAELEKIAGNEAEIRERFYKDLTFGTGGLRGIMGAGTNRMNRYTVTKATQGLADYILEHDGRDKGVALAYDSRHFSEKFSEWAALCLNANGIKTYRFVSLRPTPELSFAVRELGCIAGIVITASHNPPEYNGYKVYWEDGGQITAPRDKELIERIHGIKSFSDVKSMSREAAVRQGLYREIGKEIDDRYLEEVQKLISNPKAIKKNAGKLRVVYTPLHGAGKEPVCRLLKETGFSDFHVVKEQEKPDGDFPTLDYPNPEDPKAFSHALKLAEQVHGDLVLAADPDADRLGVYVLDRKTNAYVPFSGNVTGIFLMNYLLSQKKMQGILPENGVVVKTIVSSEMARAVAADYQVEVKEVLTGFKYIGEQIRLLEEKRQCQFLFGFEESYGCLAGTYARDKDGVAAVLLICEAAAYYMGQGLTPLDVVNGLYEKYGYYREEMMSYTFEGESGARHMTQIMERLRCQPPARIGSFAVTGIHDYQTGKACKINRDSSTDRKLPISNVLYFELEKEAWCCARPSGTEPKIKFYLGTKGNSREEAGCRLGELKAAIVKMLQYAFPV